MSTVINYNLDKEIVVVAGGHPYERDAFCGCLFETLNDFRWSLVEQPAARRLYRPDVARHFAAFVCYDMPGVNFYVDDRPAYVQPDKDYERDFFGLLEAGMGFVFLHHTISAWPGWPEYRDVLGGIFQYRPGSVRGKQLPDSGYTPEVEHTIRVLREHPVTMGVPDRFNMTEELYMYSVFAEDVIPLLQSEYSFTDDNFYCSKQAVDGKLLSREGWHHPPSSPLVGWVKHYRNSPIVYLQGGHGPAAYGNEHFCQMLHNAIRWVSSEEAHLWARQRNGI